MNEETTFEPVELRVLGLVYTKLTGFKVIELVTVVVGLVWITMLVETIVDDVAILYQYFLTTKVPLADGFT